MKRSDIPVLAAALAPVLRKHIERGVELAVEGLRLEVAALKAAAPARGADGVGVARAIQADDGHLFLCLTNGETVDVGRIRGRDGEAGRNVDEPIVRGLLDEIAALKAEIAALKAAPEPIDETGIQTIAAAEVAKLMPAVPTAEKAPEPEALAALVTRLVDGAVAAAMEAAPKPREIDPAEVRAVAAEAAAEVLAALPKPKDGEPGKSVTIDDVRPLIDAEVARRVAEIPPPRDGESVDMAEVDRMIAERVAALPRPEPGKSVTLDDVRPLVTEEVGKAMAEIPPPKDGVGLAGGMIDRGGNLILTLTDGSQRDLGPVVGADCDMVKVAELIGEELSKWPRPRDGIDGLGVKDLDVVQDGRAIVLRWSNGDRTEERRFEFPVAIYRGVFKEGHAYKPGDMVTFGGNVWHCNEATGAKPSEAAAAWRLAVRKGGDGRSAFEIARRAGFAGTEADWLASLKGEKGDPGPRGRDLTQIGPDGSKW